MLTGRSVDETDSVGKAPEIHVVAAVIQRAGKYLVCQRAAQKRHGGLWEFPGGKVESGESFFLATVRELREELDLEVTSVGMILFRRIDSASGFSINFVDVNVVDREPTLLEHSAYAWLSAEQLVTWPLAPSDLEFAQFLNTSYRE